MNKVSKLKIVINNSINKLNKKFIQRERKIKFEDIIYGLSLKTINNYSFDKVVYDLNKKTSKNMSSSGFKKKNNILKSIDIKNLNNSLLGHIYNNSSEQRVLAVDGCNLKTKKSLNKDGLKFSSKNENYTSSIISGLYDVNKKIAINYEHSISMNERKSFKNQLKYVKKGDILIFDRGYYENDLVNELNKRNINYIFRVPKSLINVKFLIENKLKEHYFTNNNIKYKIINYKMYEESIEENKKNNKNEKKIYDEYYIFTNLIYKTIDELKNLYKQRWSIETHFKELKYTTSLSNININFIDSLLKEIFIHNYVFILYYYFIECIKENTDNYQEFNNKLGLRIFIEDILYILIYKKKYKDYILIILKIIPKAYKHKEERHFERISIIKVSKWYIKPKKNKYNLKKNNNLPSDIT